MPSKSRCREEEAALSAVIERGMAAGDELRFERMSEQRPGEIPGDVVLRLRQKPHPYLTRSSSSRDGGGGEGEEEGGGSGGGDGGGDGGGGGGGDDLRTSLSISLKEALLSLRQLLQARHEHDRRRA